MRTHRLRPTVRLLMALVAVVAASIGLWKRAVRRAECLRNAAASRKSSEFQVEIAGWAEDLARGHRDRGDPESAAPLERYARLYERRAAHFRRWEAPWRDVADHPWRATPTPEPVPE